MKKDIFYLVILLAFIFCPSCKKNKDGDLSAAPIKAPVVDMLKAIYADDIANYKTIQLVASEGPKVEEFGAIANDGKDDSFAFQTAIDKGYDLVIGSGKYNINNTIIVKDKSNVQIYGTGNSELISIDKANTDVFRVLNTQGIMFSNITFVGGAMRSDEFNKGINFEDDKSNYIGIFNCNFTGDDTHGFNFAIDFHYGGNYIIVSGNDVKYLMGSTSGNGYGIHVKFVSHVKIFNNHFVGIPKRSRHAIYLSAGAKNCIVANNYIRDFDWEGITMNCFSYQDANQNNLIKNNTIIAGATDSYPGIAQISVFGKCWDITIEGNILVSSKKMGIFVSGSSGSDFLPVNVSSNIFIINNLIDNAGSYGVSVSGAKNITISENLINNAGLNDPVGYGYPAIYISTNLYDFTLPSSHDITLRKNTVSGNKVTRSSLYLDPAYKLSYNINSCSNNTFPLMRTAAIEANGIPINTVCN